MKKEFTLVFVGMFLTMHSRAQQPKLTIDPTYVSTVAGNGTPTVADGTGTAATFRYPSGVTTDASGLVYVPSAYIEFSNPVRNYSGLRRIAASGAVVTTLAGGSGGSAYITPVDGPGANAVFVNPIDAEIDAAGNVYVLDNDYGISGGGAYVRMVTPAGQVATLWHGYDFSNLYNFKAMAVSQDGTVYVSYANTNGFNEGIVNATTNTLVFDGGDSRNPPYFQINKFTLNPQGGFLIANDGHRILRLVGNSVTTFAGTGVNGDNGDGGLATLAAIARPQDVEIDALNNVYVITNNRIRKISPAGYITALAGNNNFPNNGYADGNGINAVFNSPAGIKTNAAGDILYIADATNHRIRKISAPVLNPFSTITSYASSSQYFSVSGAYLTGNAIINAPAGYEISLNEASGYAVNLSLTPQLGDVLSRNIYVRLAAATAPGTYNGNIALSSVGAGSVSMPVTGVVDPHKQGEAFNFNGSGYTNIPTNNYPVGNSNYTIECWVKSSEDRFNNIIIWGYNDFNKLNGLALLVNNKIDNYWGGQNNPELVVDAPTVNDGSWHHIAATYDGTTRKIYMDGVLLGSDNPTGHSTASGSTGYLAGFNYSLPFKGTLDEVRVFSKALTQAEINTTMNCEIPGNTTGLSAYYKFNQGLAFEENTSLTGFTDASPNGNNSVYWNGYTISGSTSNFVAPGAIVNNQVCTECATPVIAAIGPVLFCEGGSVSLTASMGTSYLWSNGATTQSINVNTSGNYKVTVTDAARGCSGTSQEITITVNPLPAIPTISPTPSNNTYNGGVPTNIYLGYGPQSVNLSSSGSAGVTYSWSPTGGLNNPSMASSIFTPTATGNFTFTLSVTNALGCTSKRSITICVLDVRVPGTDSKKIYVCEAPSGNQSKAKTLSISINAVAAYLSKPGNGGRRLGSCIEVPCSALMISQESRQSSLFNKVLGGELKISALPNPTAGNFKLTIKSAQTNPVTVHVVDMNGRVIFKQSNVQPNTTLQIGGNFSTGSYLVEAIQGNTRQSMKLIKVN